MEGNQRPCLVKTAAHRQAPTCRDMAGNCSALAASLGCREKFLCSRNFLFFSFLVHRQAPTCRDIAGNGSALASNLGSGSRSIRLLATMGFTAASLACHTKLSKAGVLGSKVVHTSVLSLPAPSSSAQWQQWKGGHSGRYVSCCRPQH
eukprot:1155283-Pelagomonas_calceolata.AAC.11